LSQAPYGENQVRVRSKILHENSVRIW
jgi:hypothetical protein